MRDPCIDCVVRHLAQAHVLLEEAAMGYPNHVYLAIGHIAEASEEIRGISQDMALDLRRLRKQIEQDEDAEFNALVWFDRVLSLDAEEAVIEPPDGPDDMSEYPHYDHDGYAMRPNPSVYYDGENRLPCGYGEGD